MSITDELREWGNRWEDVVADEIDAIADRIDEECRRRVEEAYEMGCFEYGEPQGFVKLPVDADGVPIRVGDTIEIDHNGRVTQVDCITCWEESWMVCCSEGGMFDPKNTLCRHVQRDSWERIIKDAQEYVTDDEPLYSVSELVERCRRLAGEA